MNILKHLVGQKIRFEEVGESPLSNSCYPVMGHKTPPTSNPNKASLDTRKGSPKRSGPAGKKLKGASKGLTGPLIRVESFLDSPLSPHLKLKALLHRQVSTRPQK